MICNKCELDKDKSDFYKNDTSYCASCRKIIRKAWVENNKERYREITRTYRNTEKFKAKNRKYYKEWYSRNGRTRDPLKMAAHAIVAEALKQGRLYKALVCSKCDRKTKIEGHHKDYLKPLEIIWLCNRCHREIHTGY